MRKNNSDLKIKWKKKKSQILINQKFTITNLDQKNNINVNI